MVKPAFSPVTLSMVAVRIDQKKLSYALLEQFDHVEPLTLIKQRGRIAPITPLFRLSSPTYLKVYTAQLKRACYSAQTIARIVERHRDGCGVVYEWDGLFTTHLPNNALSDDHFGAAKNTHLEQLYTFYQNAFHVPMALIGV